MPLQELDSRFAVPPERFRIVKAKQNDESGLRSEIFLAPGEEEWARRMLAWHRSMTPAGFDVWLERQDTTPRPWERLND